MWRIKEGSGVDGGMKKHKLLNLKNFRREHQRGKGVKGEVPLSAQSSKGLRVIEHNRKNNGTTKELLR